MKKKDIPDYTILSSSIKINIKCYTLISKKQSSFIDCNSVFITKDYFTLFKYIFNHKDVGMHFQFHIQKFHFPLKM